MSEIELAYYECCKHCEHTDQATDPCGQHIGPCEHGCNDETADDE